MIGFFVKSIKDLLFSQNTSTIDIGHTFLNTEAVGQKSSVKKVFLQISENSQENICI